MKQLLSILLLFSFLCVGCSGTESRKTYRVARDPSWYPLSLSGKAPSLFGFSDELISEISSAEHLSIQLFSANWDYLLEGLRQEKWDGILTSTAPQLPFTEEFVFSDPFFYLGDVLIVPISSPIHSLEDLKGREVGTLANSPIIINLAQDPSTVIHICDSGAQCLAELTSGRIDALFLPNILAHSFVNDLYAGQLRIASSPQPTPALYFAALKDEPALVEGFNAGLKKIMANGIYQQLLNKWQLQ